MRRWAFYPSDRVIFPNRNVDRSALVSLNKEVGEHHLTCMQSDTAYIRRFADACCKLHAGVCVGGMCAVGLLIIADVVVKVVVVLLLEWSFLDGEDVGEWR